MLTGISHLTLAVGDLSRSVDFYQRVLGLRLRARWETGAYLEAGDLWLCLSLDELQEQAPRADYTHYAFSIGEADFPAFVAELRARGIREWKPNSSEGTSCYFLDPDGHKLEIHVGSLETRLVECRRRPYRGMEFFD